MHGRAQTEQPEELDPAPDMRVGLSLKKSFIFAPSG
jgi:hypothetical protein